MEEDLVPRALLDAVLEYGWSVTEGLGPFHPFGTCPTEDCGYGLWPVDETDPDGPKRCDECGTEVDQ